MKKYTEEEKEYIKHLLDKYDEAWYKAETYEEDAYEIGEELREIGIDPYKPPGWTNEN